MGEDGELLSREEVLGGLPARRARTLVYLIETAAARHRASRAVGPMSLLGESTAEARELAWLEAFALGDETPHRASILQIEESAERWAPLVPASPEVRAAATRLFSERHRLDRRLTPGTRAALGLDTDEVAAAFQRQTGRPIDSIWSRARPVERLRWLMSAPGRWLDRTSAFRAAAALTFLLSMGQSVVIVPIAVAEVGPVAAAASIFVVGLLALSATAAVAEATTRNGEVRFRGGFFGRLVTSALGSRAGAVPALLGIAGVVLPTLSTFIGLALLLKLTIPIPAVGWVVVLGAIAIAIPLGPRRTASFGGLMVFGLVSTSLLFVLSVLALVSAGINGDLHAPSLSPPGGLGLTAALGVIVGVLLGSYADPVYAVQIGRIVLPRDPDGIGFVRGSVVGMAAFVVLTALFSAVLLFALPAAELAAENGSALDTVAARFGGPALALATIIGIGLFGLRLYGNTIALFDFVAERLPGKPVPRVVLRAGGRRVVLSRRAEGHASDLSLAFHGLRDDRPVIEIAGGAGRDTEVRHLDPPGGTTTISADSETLGLEVLEADEAMLRLALHTELPISYDGDPAASSRGVAESLLAADDTGRLTAWLLREGGGTPAEVGEHFGWTEAAARERLEAMVAAGAATKESGRFTARVAARRRRGGLETDVWSRIGLEADTSSEDADATARHGLFSRLLASAPGRAVVASLPTAAVAAIAIAMLVAGTATVSGPFRIVGVIAFATISGVLPPMLLLAARRRSDVAGAGGGGVLVGRVLMGLTAISALAALILHATVLWSNPFERACAGLAALFAIAAMVLAARHGAFRPAAILELRQAVDGGPVRVRGEENGQPLQTEIRLGDRELRSDQTVSLGEAPTLTVRGHATEADELRISAQRLEASGVASPLPLIAQLARGEEKDKSDEAPVRLDERGGSASFPTAHDWTLVLRSEEAAVTTDDADAAPEGRTPRGRRTARKGSPLDKL